MFSSVEWRVLPLGCNSLGRWEHRNHTGVSVSDHGPLPFCHSEKFFFGLCWLDWRKWIGEESENGCQIQHNFFLIVIYIIRILVHTVWRQSNQKHRFCIRTNKCESALVYQATEGSVLNEGVYGRNDLGGIQNLIWSMLWVCFVALLTVVCVCVCYWSDVLSWVSLWNYVNLSWTYLFLFICVLCCLVNRAQEHNKAEQR